MRDVFSISRLTNYIKDLFDTDPMLGDVWLRGEVSNWSRASSGHCYFTLKDDDAELRCVMWRSVARQLLVLPNDGDEIVAQGRVTVYPQRGQYQFYVNEIEPIGQGVLYQRLEALKAKLRDEGLFDEARKRPLPAFPRRIGVVTSATGAAFRDILNVLQRRHPLVEVILSPTLVQGSDAPEQIVAALDALRKTDIDLVIVTRGGGSLEDLWCFNEELVARAIYAYHVPVISGVGHEIDFTIADYVADHRAPTPSAAAELAVPDTREVRETIRAMQTRLDRGVESVLFDARQQAEQQWRLLERCSPAGQIEQTRATIQGYTAQMARRVDVRMELERARLSGVSGRLHELDPDATLARGYAIVSRADDGRLVRSPAEVSANDAVHITVEGGTFAANVDADIEND